MLAVLSGVDAVAFSGGIGENSPAVRAAVCSGMEWCGLALDPALNAEPPRGGSIGSAGSRAGVCVVRADEERVIAEETCALLASET
jgi:acetate kinase